MCDVNCSGAVTSHCLLIHSTTGLEKKEPFIAMQAPIERVGEGGKGVGGVLNFCVCGTPTAAGTDRVEF